MTGLIRVLTLVLVVTILSIAESGRVLMTRVIDVGHKGKLLWIIEYTRALAWTSRSHHHIPTVAICAAGIWRLEQTNTAHRGW